MSDNPYQAPGAEEALPPLQRTDAMIVKSIGVLSAAKVMACLYALIGLIVGGLFTLFAVAGASSGLPNSGGANLVVGGAMVIMLPIGYGIAGFVGGLLLAALYNQASSIFGGLEIELKPRQSDLG